MIIPEHIFASIVGIQADGRPREFSPSVLSLPIGKDGPRTPESLGIVVGGFVLSCAHIQPSYAMRPGDFDLFTAWCINEPGAPTGQLAAVYASNLDYLVLGPDTFSVAMSDGGGTESGLELIASVQEKWSDAVRPTRITLAEGAESATFNGYFFGADGRTAHHSKFQVFPKSHKISFHSPSVGFGVSGSPIFTDAHHLIGFVTHSSSQPDLNGLPHCLGCRFDLGLPQVIQQQLTWDSIAIGPTATT